MTATDALDNPSYFVDAGEDRSSNGPAPESTAPAVPAPPTRPLLPLLKRRGRAAIGPRAGSQGPAERTSRRLGFRWLLRSINTSSASLQQIALGQPRPGDVAPASPSASASDVDAITGVDALGSPGPVVGPGRLRELRATGTAGPPKTTRGCGYYNVPRRHSVGSLVHSRDVGSPPTSGSTPTSRPSSVPDDIVLIWSGSGGSSAAALWITYLQSCFVEICRKRGRPSFRTSDVSVDELGGESDGAERWRTRLEQAKLVVLLVCPAMLARVSSCPASLAGPMARLDSERALVMLLGVLEHELQPEHRAVLGGDCKRMTVRDQDASFVGEFLAVAMDILVRAWRAKSINDHRVGDGSALFTLAPKKVKQGMSKVLVLLVAPLQPGAKVHVALYKAGEPSTVPARTRNPYTVQFTVPESMLDVSAMINVSVSVGGQLLGCRQLKCESRLRELDRILRAKDNPQQFLCQTLGFGPGDREALDNSLLCSYLRNVPPHFNLLSSQGGPPSYSCEMFPTLLHFAAHFGLERLAMALVEGPGGEQACYIRNCDDLSPAELSERAGFDRLAGALQGYMHMSELSNVYSLLQTIDDMGSGAGFAASGESGSYLSPRPASETYCVPPPPALVGCGLSPAPPAPPDPYVDMAGETKRPRDSTALYQNEEPQVGGALTPSTRRSSVPEEVSETVEDVAVYQDIENEESPSHPVSERQREPNVCSEDGDNVKAEASTATAHRQGSAMSTTRRGRELVDHASAAGDETDEDLMDVIHDLKSSSFSLGEVEHLVQTWRSRNAAHHTFSEKQEQLTRMREELERVEQRLGGDDTVSGARRPSPLERIKRVFARVRHTKNKGKGSLAEPRGGSGEGYHGNGASAAVSHSSLSRRSSSSSTWSGKSADQVDSPSLVEVDEVSWLHPVSPASDEHYVSPLGVRPALAEDGFPLDLAGFSSYVNVCLPRWPPPVPARLSSSASAHI